MTLLYQTLRTTSKPTRHAGAFTLPELLVVTGMTALLAAILLSAAFTSREQVMRAECASNLKQIGAAVGVYSVENNDYVPLISWKDAPPSGTGNPWQTSEICRIQGIGSRVIVEGPYGLGLLFFGKQLPDPKVLYCPNVQSGFNTYGTYSEPGWPWPSIPPDFNPGGNPYVRCGYNYYPQSTRTEFINDPIYGPVTLPILREQTMTLVSPNPSDPPQSHINMPVPLRVADMNPALSLATDVMINFRSLSHQSAGRPVGANVLFTDGHVTFVTVRNNNIVRSQRPFDPKLWDPYDSGGTGPGNDPTGFRIIMNGWTP